VIDPNRAGPSDQTAPATPQRSPNGCACSGRRLRWRARSGQRRRAGRRSDLGIRAGEPTRAAGGPRGLTKDGFLDDSRTFASCASMGDGRSQDPRMEPS
jgi:hypothetical protein